MPSRPQGSSARDCLAARTEGRRFPVALALRKIDVEHVDLVVAGNDLALGPEQEAAIGASRGVELDRQRPDQQPCACLRRQVLEGGDRRVAVLRHAAWARIWSRLGSMEVVFSGVRMNSAPASRASRTKT